jgi:hypothetical protein
MKEEGKMKRLSSLVLVFLLVLGFTAQAMAQEWSEPDWADLRPLTITFDKIELFIHSGAQTFVCPPFENPHAPDSSPMDWVGGIINSNYILATGTATQAVGWTDYFSGPQSETFTLTLLAYSGATLVFGGDCDWDGSSYSCPSYWTDAGSDPHPGIYDRTAEWSRQDWANLIPLDLTFDKMELFISDGSQTFVDPGIDDFRDQTNTPNDWQGVICNPAYCTAWGSATQYVRWFDHMSGPRSNTFTLTGLFWLEGVFVLGQDVAWNGCDGYVQSQWWTEWSDPHYNVYDRSGCSVSTEEASWGKVKALYR